MSFMQSYTKTTIQPGQLTYFSPDINDFLTKFVANVDIISMLNISCDLDNILSFVKTNLTSPRKLEKISLDYAIFRHNNLKLYTDHNILLHNVDFGNGLYPIELYNFQCTILTMVYFLNQKNTSIYYFLLNMYKINYNIALNYFLSGQLGSIDDVNLVMHPCKKYNDTSIYQIESSHLTHANNMINIIQINLESDIDICLLEKAKIILMITDIKSNIYSINNDLSHMLFFIKKNHSIFISVKNKNIFLKNKTAYIKTFVDKNIKHLWNIKGINIYF
ncbi:hypothetical protein nvc1_019 [Namao virus]|nr:hypothetical protein nvc1_019 [Namao virus]